MSEYAKSPKRDRIYKRSFNHDEARRRAAAGETLRDIAADYGVSPGQIWNVVRRPTDTQTITVPDTLPPSDGLLGAPYTYDRCPTCQGRKKKTSRLCVTCSRDSRLAPSRVVRVPGQKRVPLLAVRVGSVVQYKGRWAVLENDPAEVGERQGRILHFWDGPPERVGWRENVDMAPYCDVVVDAA